MNRSMPARRRMRLRCVVLAALLLPVLACGLDAPGNDSEPVAPTATGPKPNTASVGAGEDISGFLAAARGFEVDVIRTDENRTVRWARRLCEDIRGGMSGAPLDHRAAERFTGGDVTLTDAQGAKMVALVRRYMCP